MTTRIFKYFVLTVCLTVIFIPSCKNSNNNIPKPKLKFAYKPPVIPIRLCVDTEGNIYFESSDFTIPTIIGEFSFNAELPVNDKNGRLLYVRDNKKRTIKVVQINSKDGSRSTKVKYQPIEITVSDSSKQLIEITSTNQVKISRPENVQTNNWTQVKFTGNWLIDQKNPDFQNLDRNTKAKLLQQWARSRKEEEVNRHYPFGRPPNPYINRGNQNK